MIQHCEYRAPGWVCDEYLGVEYPSVLCALHRKNWNLFEYRGYIIQQHRYFPEAQVYQGTEHIETVKSFDEAKSNIDGWLNAR